MTTSSPLRIAAAAAAVLLAGACSSSSPGEESQRVRDRSASTSAGEEPTLTVGRPVELAESGALNPTVAVDVESGAMYAAWAWDIPQPEDASLVGGTAPKVVSEVVVAASADGGRTFGEPVVVSPSGMHVRSMSVSPTQVAVGPEGEVYVLYLENKTTGRDLPGFAYGLSTMWLSRSDDGGRSFSAPVAVTSEDDEGVATSTEMATLLVAPDGDLFVSFLDFRQAIQVALDKRAGKIPEYPINHAGEHPPEPATQLRLSRSADGGRSWSPSVLVAEGAGECSGTQAAQSGAEGPLIVATRTQWLEGDGSDDAVRDPFVSVSTNDGATFSKARKVHDDRFKTSGCPDVTAGLAADPGGKVHAAWYTGARRGPGVYHATSDDDGTTWSRPRRLLSGDWVPSGDVRLAVDDQGAAWVAFEDRRDEQEDRIQVVRVAPGGAVDASRRWAGRAPYLAPAGDGVIVAWGVRATGDVAGSANVARVRLREGAGSAES